MPHSSAARREQLVRRLFLRAISLFLALFIADLFIVGWLFFHDFDQRAIRSKLAEAADSARILANNLYREMAPAGSFDFVRIVARRVAIGQMIDQYTAQLKFVKFVDVVDRNGRVLLRRSVDEGGLSQLRLGGSFGGEAPPSPDSPPSFPMLTEGQQFLAVTSPSQVRVVPVPFGAGAGTLVLGMTAAPQDEEIGRLRQTLIMRLLAGGAVSLVLLGIAFTYVLRLVHRTRRLEADAQRAEQLAYLGTLASGLAHEIRNPLNAMNINLQMLEEELAAGPVQGEPLDLLRSSRSEVLRLERLVKDFLAFARPQTTRREELAPAELVGDVVRFMRPLFQEARVGLELVQEPGAPAVRIDPGQIRQALLNVLQNALEASPPGSAVTATVGATARGEARIDIRDQGPGIPEDIRREIFQVFWSKKPAGSGLGLPIAQRALEAHGGRIELESSEGQGSVFRLVLPSAFEAAAQPADATTTGNGGRA